jgi:hypothetical protein
MKMMGIGLVLARWRCNWRPSMFGIETSRTTQDTSGNCGESRKLRTEVKLAVRNPIDLSRLFESLANKRIVIHDRDESVVLAFVEFFNCGNWLFSWTRAYPT